MGNDSIIKVLTNVKGIATLAIVIIIIALLNSIAKQFNVTVLEIVRKITFGAMKHIGKLISKKERQYHRDIEIGKLSDKKSTVKIYKFFSRLIVDLRLTGTKVTPYELMVFVLVGCLIIAYVLTSIMFTSNVMIIFTYPICVIAVLCMMFTRGNLAHDARITAVIEAENIICNNIKGGVVVAIKENLDVIPEEVRVHFSDFLDNIEFENYHVKDALEELNVQLGPIADDFIKKCMVYEMEEEHGIVDMFSDIVEINNARTDKRIELKHELDEKVNELKASSAMLAIFVVGLLIIFPEVRELYFDTIIGNIIMVGDLLIAIVIYAISTVVMAAEL